MTEQAKTQESAADRAIREALESVERIQREREAKEHAARAASDASEEGSILDVSADGIEVLQSTDIPPSGDRSSPVNDEATARSPAPKKNDAVLEAMIKAKGELQEVLAQTQKEAKDMFDRLARVSADVDNYEKRQGRERADAVKFANEGLLKELLPVLDNLNRAVGAAPPTDSASQNLVSGLKLVQKQFEDALGRFGVQGFSALGTTFDPGKHEAVGGRPDADKPANVVLEEFQRGYMLNDRLVRPALVIVSSGPPEDAPN